VLGPFSDSIAGKRDGARLSRFSLPMGPLASRELCRPKGCPYVVFWFVYAESIETSLPLG